MVFPAIPEATERSVQVREEIGVDVTAFTEQAAAEDGTFLFPITDYGSQINSIMTEAIQAMGLGQAEPGPLLERANEEINDLF